MKLFWNLGSTRIGIALNFDSRAEWDPEVDAESDESFEDDAESVDSADDTWQDEASLPSSPRDSHTSTTYISRAPSYSRDSSLLKNAIQIRKNDVEFSSDESKKSLPPNPPPKISLISPEPLKILSKKGSLSKKLGERASNEVPINDARRRSFSTSPHPFGKSGSIENFRILQRPFSKEMIVSSSLFLSSPRSDGTPTEVSPSSQDLELFPIQNSKLLPPTNSYFNSNEAEYLESPGRQKSESADILIQTSGSYYYMAAEGAYYYHDPSVISPPPEQPTDFQEIPPYNSPEIIEDTFEMKSKRNSIQISDPGDFHVDHISAYKPENSLIFEENGDSESESDEDSIPLGFLAPAAALALSKQAVGPADKASNDRTPSLHSISFKNSRSSIHENNPEASMIRTLEEGLAGYSLNVVNHPSPPILTARNRLQEGNFRTGSTLPSIPKRMSSLTFDLPARPVSMVQPGLSSLTFDLPARPVSMVQPGQIPKRVSSLPQTPDMFIIPKRGESIIRSPRLNNTRR